VIKDHFVEGCAEINQHIVVLTWRARLAPIFDLRTLTFERTLTLFTEGWGLASSSRGLIYSDGSSSLRWLNNPDIKEGTQLEVLRDVTVRDQDAEIYQLNELEWFDDYLLANIYPHDKIAVIEPESGHVKAWLDLSGLRHHELPTARELNGIAYHDVSDTLLVTGKGWGQLYVLDSGWLRKVLSMI
jgi:glutamine cyclotransferase